MEDYGLAVKVESESPGGLGDRQGDRIGEDLEASGCCVRVELAVREPDPAATVVHSLHVEGLEPLHATTPRRSDLNHHRMGVSLHWADDAAYCRPHAIHRVRQSVRLLVR